MENDLKCLSVYREPFQYRDVGDAVYLFSSEEKISHFFEFMCDDLEELKVNYLNDKLKMLPVVYYASNTINKPQFITVDYIYLLQTIARYIDTYELGDAGKFVSDFCYDPDFKQTKHASIMLFSGYMEKVLRLTHVNGNHKNTKAIYLTYATPSVYKNVRTAMQIAGISFHVETLLEYVNKRTIERLFQFTVLSSAEQVAFGNECKDYWEKNKLMPTYYLAKREIIYRKKR